MTRPDGRLVLALDASEASLVLIGGKGASLARLAAARLPVPPGFLLTTTAYQRFVEANALGPTIATALTDARYDDPATLERVAATISAQFGQAMMPAEIAAAIVDAYTGLIGDGAAGADLPVAVRSSATAEDLPGLSFAGQQDTFLDVRGDAALLDAVRHCWASLWTARAIGYRQRMGIDQPGLAMGIVVQHLVPAEVSGVLFTANPITGDASELVINASVGLGETVVGGTVTPATYLLDKESGETQSTVIGAKAVLIVPESQPPAPVLSDRLLRELATIGMWVEHFFGGVPQDVEWAVAGGQCWLLQARPITTPMATSPMSGCRASSGAPGTMLQGVAVSPGRITARASVVLASTDLTAMEPGTILICPALTPAWTPLLGLAAGLVAEDGGVLAHGAIVAREYGVPAVMGVGDATVRIRSGQRITVDGDAGSVTLLAAED